MLPPTRTRVYPDLCVDYKQISDLVESPILLCLAVCVKTKICLAVSVRAHTLVKELIGRCCEACVICQNKKKNNVA